MTCSALDIEDKAISRKLLATLHSDDISRLHISPKDWQESLDLACNHEIFDLLVIDFASNFSLPHLQSQILNAHEPNVDRQSDNRKRYFNLIVILRVHNQEKENNGQDVFKMNNGINQEIPYTKSTLISVGVDFVLVLYLIGYNLMELATFELHLLFVKLVFNYIRASFTRLKLVFISFFLVV